MKLILYFILFLSFFRTFSLPKSQGDTSKTERKAVFPKVSSEWEFDRQYSFSSIVYTSISYIHLYKPKNDLGNYGLAIFPLSPTPPRILTGFRYKQEPLELFLLSRENRSYYKAIDPFTELVFILGQKKEQAFRFIHTQNVNKNLNFAAVFSRLRSEGFYRFQNTNHNSLSLTSNYQSSNKKYFLLSAFCYNRLNNNENGGIEKDSAFENSLLNDRKLIAVNLEGANRMMRNKSFLLKQYFNFYSGKNSLNDSSIVKKSFPVHSLIHTFSAEDNSLLYADKNPAGGFYKEIFLDSVETRDSVYFYTFRNELRYRLRFQKAGMDAGIRHEYTWLTENMLDTSLINTMVFGEFTANPFRRTGITLKYETVVSGNMKNNYLASAAVHYFFNDSLHSLYANGIYSELTPDFIYNYHNSNHYRWANAYSRQVSAIFEIGFVSKKYRMSAGARSYYYSGFPYLDSYAYPSWSNESYTIPAVFIQKEFLLGKFHFTNSVTYQDIPRDIPVRLPDIITRHSLFYENMIFKKALHFQAGVDVFYHSLYYSNAWSPALGMYYLQDKKETGNYPLVDAFINMNIRTARVFIKYEHLNAALMGFRYYGAPSYPLPDRALKFGISWMMFN